MSSTSHEGDGAIALLALMLCCFFSNVLHGFTGCGSVLVLHALWQLVITVAPDVVSSEVIFHNGDVKSIAEFSYVLAFLIQVILTILIFSDDRRRHLHQVAPNLPELNGGLLLALIPCSFVGALVGILTMESLNENGLRIILGASCLFFSLTFLALYQMKHLEKKKKVDVIRDDLRLMRMESDMRRNVLLECAEEAQRRHEQDEVQERKAWQQCRGSCHADAASTVKGSDTSETASLSPRATAARVYLESSSPLPLLHEQEVEMGSSTSRSISLSANWHELAVHPSPSHVPTVHFITPVYLSTTSPVNRIHRQRGGLEAPLQEAPKANVRTYLRRRLSEMSQQTDSTSTEEKRNAYLAGLALREMGHSANSCYITRDGSKHGLPSESGGDGESDKDSSSEGAAGFSVGTTTRTDDLTSVSEVNKIVATAEAQRSSVAAIPLDARQQIWSDLLAGRTSASQGTVDLAKSIVFSTATQSHLEEVRRSEAVSISLHESQQRRLHGVQLQSGKEYARSHRERFLNFAGIDGGVVTAAMVSAFFSGLLGSYTGVADPPLTIFALAMDISSSVFRINYAVSSIVPAALRAAIGITDGFANSDLLLYYILSALFSGGGIACGLYLSRDHDVSQRTFMGTTLTTMMLLAALMLVPVADVLTRVVVTGVATVIVVALVFRQVYPPEHHRPPAPPNTPTTAAEQEAWEQHWAPQGGDYRCVVDATPYDGDRATVPPCNVSANHFSEDVYVSEVHSAASAYCVVDAAPSPLDKSALKTGLQAEELPWTRRDTRYVEECLATMESSIAHANLHPKRVDVRSRREEER